MEAPKPGDSGMWMWVGAVVFLASAAVVVWWLTAPARERRKASDARRRRYVVKDNPERLAMADAGRTATGTTLALEEIRPAERARDLRGASGGEVRGRLVQTLDGERILTTPPFALKESVLGDRGAKYFAALSARVPAWVVVCPKVRLDAIVTPTNPAGLDAAEFAVWRRRARMRSVDYLLCDRRTFKPLLAVVVERAHKRGHVELGGGQDRIPDEVLRTVGLTLVRVSGDFAKDWGLIKPYVDQAILPSVSEDAIDDAHAMGVGEHDEGAAAGELLKLLDEQDPVKPG